MKWNDYRREDALYAKLPVFRTRIARSKRIVEQWLEQCERPYIAVSGGKDSVAMLHLIQTTAEYQLPVMWHDSGVEWPETDAVFEQLKQRSLIKELHVVKPDHDVVQLKQMQMNGEISAAKKDQLSLFNPINNYVYKHRFDGMAIGLRKEEGRGRCIDGAIHGAIYRKKDGLLRCLPLTDWKWQDVFAYIAEHHLPLHPIYSAPLLTLENRGRIRLSWWISTDHNLHGQLAWVRDNFPDIYQRLRIILPDVRAIT